MSSSQQHSRQPRSLQPVPDAEQATFGTWLRRQRELREISLREIADVTKISIRYLEALEKDRFDVLPAPVFARGFLREYARFVGLNPDEVVNSYISAQKTIEPDEEITKPVRRRRTRPDRSSTILLVIAVVVVLAVVAGIAYYVERRNDAKASQDAPSTPTLAQPDNSPTNTGSSSEPPVAATAAEPQLITLEFSDRCWIEILNGDGSRTSEVHVAGESLQFEGVGKVVLTVDNPDAVQVVVDDRPVEIQVDRTIVPHVIEIDLMAYRTQGQ